MLESAIDSNPSVIQQYESVLQRINQEFQSMLAKNAQYEMDLRQRNEMQV